MDGKQAGLLLCSLVLISGFFSEAGGFSLERGRTLFPKHCFGVNSKREDAQNRDVLYCD